MIAEYPITSLLRFAEIKANACALVEQGSVTLRAA